MGKQETRKGVGLKPRVLLDTNVYGFLLRSSEATLLEEVRSTHAVTFYGFDVIRGELRAIPQTAKECGRSLRNLALNLYDKLVGRHHYTKSNVVEALAVEYVKAYEGGISAKAMWSDFLIVACATVHGLDVVVSEDRHSLLSAPALRAYKKVNKANDFGLPAFYPMEALQKLL